MDQNSAFADMVRIIAALVKKLIERLKDGFQFLPDLMASSSELMQIPTAVSEAPEAWAWMKDMTDEKLDEIVTAVMNELGSSSQAAKVFITHIIKALAHGYMAWLTGKELSAANSETESKG